MTPSEVREMTDAELVEALAEAKEERFNLRFQLATNQLDNQARIKAVKQDIARILTVPAAHPPPPTLAAVELDLTLREVERRHIERVLAAEGGHVERAARRLGIPRSSLYQKLKSLGLSSRV